MTLKKELPIKYFDAATAGSDSAAASGVASKYSSSAKTSFAIDNSVATDAVSANASFTMDSFSAAESSLTGDI